MKKILIFIIIIALVIIGTIWRFSKANLAKKNITTSEMQTMLDELSAKRAKLIKILQAKGIAKSEMLSGIDKGISIQTLESEKYPKEKKRYKDRDFLKWSEVPTKDKIVRKKSDDF